MHLALIYVYLLHIVGAKACEDLHILIILNNQMISTVRFDLHGLVWSHLVIHTGLDVVHVDEFAEIICKFYFRLTIIVVTCDRFQGRQRNCRAIWYLNVHISV